MSGNDQDPSSNNSSSDEEDESVEAAVLQRGRRATAGRRLTTLTGQAAEDDTAFWGHDTWGEEDDGSFRESDEDSEQRVDTFDSDFDDDEAEEADNEKEKAAAAEAEIARQEREDRKKKRGFAEPSKKRPTMRRIVGEGLNAGIVLNAPGQAPVRPAVTVARSTGGKTSAMAAANFATLAATRKPRRSTSQSKYSSRYRSAKQTNDGEASQAVQQAVEPAPQLGQPPSNNKRKLTAAERAGDKKKPKRFAQEELLLEAIHQTEPENRRWILERQRNQTEKDEAHQHAMDRKNQNSGKLVERYTSRRGALNLVHFPSMDHVPDILKGQKPVKAPSKTVRCVITGQPARYRDPRTGLPYYDSAAFKEIRRRHGTKKMAPTSAPTPDPKGAPQSSQGNKTATRTLHSNPSEKAQHKKPPQKKTKSAPKKKTEQTGSDAKNAADPKKDVDTKKPDESKSTTDSKKTPVNESTTELKTTADAKSATDKKSAAGNKRKAAEAKEKGPKAAKNTPVATPSSSSVNQNGGNVPAPSVSADHSQIVPNGKASSATSAAPSTVSIESSNQPSNTQQRQHIASTSPFPSSSPLLSNSTASNPTADTAPSKPEAGATTNIAKAPDSPGRRASPRRKKPSAKLLDGAPSIPH